MSAARSVISVLLSEAEVAYNSGKNDKNMIQQAKTICVKLLKRLNIYKQRNQLSSKDEMFYKSAVLQIKDMRKDLDNLRKVGFGISTRNEKPSDRVRWIEEESAFSSRISTGSIVNLKHKDSIKFLEDCSEVFKRRINQLQKIHSAIKVNAVFSGEFTLKKNTGEQLFDIKYMNTRNQPIYRDTDLRNWFELHVKEPVLKKLEEFQEKDSGWALVRIINLAVNVNKFSMLNGSSYINLPESLKRRKALVNVKNDDNACFAWAVVSALYPATSHSDRITSYPHYSSVLKLKGIEFPMTLKQISRFETLNEISVNVYALGVNRHKDAYDVLPTYLTKSKREKHVNLLMVQNVYYDDDVKSFGCNEEDYSPTQYHYVWIKNLSRLISTQLSKHDGQKFFCDRCLNYFHSQEKLNKHVEDCNNLNTCKIRMPEEENKIVSFKNYKNKEKVPFILYCDLESILKPVKEGNKYQEHVPAAIGYYVKCSFDDSLSFYRSYRGLDCIDWFTRELKQFSEDVETVFMCPYDIDSLTPEQEQEFQTATHCHICEKPFKEGDKRVRDHFHMTSGSNNISNSSMISSNGTNYRGPAHSSCNILYQDSRVIPVVFHNLSGYDAHFIIKSIALAIEGRVDLLPITKEKYISFTKHINGCSIQFRFIDSFRFTNSSLENLVNNLSHDQLKILKYHFPEENKFRLMCQKGVYPYDYMTSINTFNKKQLPSIEAFYNKLNDRPCSTQNYLHAKLVWDKFDIKDLGEYTDLYLKSDILLLADVFEQFRESCIDTYGLDPANYYTLPGYTWDCMLKYTGIKLELLEDIDQVLFIEKGIRGGLSQVSKRRCHANNKYMPNFDKSKPESYIMYWDVNNQYGWGMSKYLPYGGFRWLNNNEIEKLNVLDVSDEANTGYILEVDLEYPQNLHDLHKDIPFCPEHYSSTSKEKKLMATLKNKTKYVIHYQALKQALNHGVKLSKIHRVLKFDQSAWLKPYIELNTNLRQNAKNVFEKDLFKLMNNAVFGKTMENIRKHSKVRLVSKWDGRYGAEAYISSPWFKSRTIFDETLVAIELNKSEIYFNKPIYVGMSILDISRTSLFNYHYDYMLKVYGIDCSLLYTDTDSLIYEIRNHDPYEIMRRDCHAHYDTSDYPENNVYKIPRVNKKVIGLMKDEHCSRIATDFVGLRAKLYTVKLLPDENYRKRKREELEKDGDEVDIEAALVNEGLTKKAKGVKKSVVKTNITFDDYVSCLDNLNEKTVTQNLIKSQKFVVSSITQSKVALSPYDDKRYLLNGSYDTLPWGHYSILDKTD